MADDGAGRIGGDRLDMTHRLGLGGDDLGLGIGELGGEVGLDALAPRGAVGIDLLARLLRDRLRLGAGFGKRLLIGLAGLFGQFLSGALRNPSAADGQRGTLLLGFALTEALGIFSLLIALLLLFAV